MTVLKKDFLPESFRAVLTQNGVDGTVAVQADQTETETMFLLELANQFDYIKGVVGWVDLRSEQLDERLEYYSGFVKLKGFRHVVQDEPDDHFMLGARFQRGLSLLSKYGFTYDILIYPRQLEAAYRTILNFPEQRFVIDHIAKPEITKGENLYWKKWMKKISRADNVFCKLSGMVTEAKWYGWKYSDFIPYLDAVFESFGADRLMFGSDYPVCLLAAEYNHVKGILSNYIDTLGPEDRRKIWSENAMKFYDL